MGDVRGLLQAIDRAPTKAVKEAGDQLVVGHTDLDKRVREVATDLAIVLPTQPTAEQQGATSRS